MLFLLPLMASTALAQTAPSVTGLGFLDKGATPYSYVTAISGDGTTVLGHSSTTGSGLFASYRWTQGSGMVDLGLKFDPVALNSDGSVLVGNDGMGIPYRYTQAGGAVAIGTGGMDGFKAEAVSADGSIVLGTTGVTGITGTRRPATWTKAAGITDFGVKSVDFQYGGISGASADGTIIVGSNNNFEKQTSPFIWKKGGMLVDIGYIGGGNDASFDEGSAQAISADGTVVVGGSTTPALHSTLYQAFRWTEAGGSVGLGSLAGATGGSIANAVNGDGSIVVGNSQNAASKFEAFRWTQAGGMKSLSGLLAGAGVKLGGRTLDTAKGISTNGEFIVGESTPSGQITEAYVLRYVDGAAVVPTPTTTPTAKPTPTAPPPTPIAGITTRASVQNSIDKLAGARQNLMSQQHGFTAALLGDNNRIQGGSDAGAFVAAGSVAGGAAGQLNLGNGFALFGGLSVAQEDYTQLRTRNVVTIAAAGRYVYKVAPRLRLSGEIGGWVSPTGSYRFTRNYSNGAGIATGIGTAKGRQTYIFGRLGAAFDVTPDDEFAVSGEFGRQEFHTGGYNETLQVSNPFEAHVPGSTDRLNIGKVRAQWTHNFTPAVDTTVWVGVSHGFAYKTSLTAFIPGFAQVTPKVKGTTWAEYGLRVGYHVTEHISLDLFADGVSTSHNTRVHFGGGVKARF